MELGEIKPKTENQTDKNQDSESKSGTKKFVKDKIHKLRNAHRIVISKEAKGALDQLLNKVTEGFSAGEISKSDLVNAVLLNATKYMTDSDIKALRALHFDEAKVLAGMLKNVTQGAQLPENLKSLLRTQYGLSENSKRKNQNDVKI